MTSLQKKEEEESIQRFVSCDAIAKKREGGEYTEVCKLVPTCKKKGEEKGRQRFVSCDFISKKREGGEYTES